jgi:uncharacterized membrane protein YidH (DUF202 family)
VVDPDDAEDRDPGLARERTELAWTRTALSVAGLGAIAAHSQVVAGLVIIAAAVLIWHLGQSATRRYRPAAATWPVRRRTARLVTSVTCAVALLALALALLLPTSS